MPSRIYATARWIRSAHIRLLYFAVHLIPRRLNYRISRDAYVVLYNCAGREQEKAEGTQQHIAMMRYLKKYDVFFSFIVCYEMCVCVCVFFLAQRTMRISADGFFLLYAHSENRFFSELCVWIQKSFFFVRIVLGEGVLLAHCCCARCECDDTDEYMHKYMKIENFLC